MRFLRWELMRSYYHGRPMDKWMGYIDVKVNWLLVGFTIIQKLEHTQNVMKRLHHKFSWSFSNKKPRENQRYRWYSLISMVVQWLQWLLVNSLCSAAILGDRLEKMNWTSLLNNPSRCFGFISQPLATTDIMMCRGASKCVDVTSA